MLRTVNVFVMCVMCWGLAGCQPPEVRAELPDLITPDVVEIRAILAGVSVSLETHTEQITELEAQIAELRAELNAQPVAILPPVVEQTEAQRILDAYHGQGWFIRGARGNASRLRQHITLHGVPADGLDALSGGELERVHGAVHTQHESARMYNKIPQQAIRGGFVRIRTGTTNCPNARCRVPR